MLHLFPPSSLDSSILTSVLVGVLVVWAFQETLGWNFTGLVVPGYLGSILVIQPVTGLVILGEAVVTWLVFSALSDRIPRWWPWAPLFGRDRFFGILVVSVAVRIVLEGGGFSWIQHTFGVAVDRDLHSMSLVVVPLAANALWRTGFLAAITRIGVPVVLTWAILEVVLLRFTNLSLSSFELTYEDLALDFVSSPRAYILLLTGAWLGSSANLRWGWDYGGIIVPGLLSICWLEPSRLVATLVEAFVIATLVRLVVRTPVLANANLTGGRPLVLAFTLSYAVKFALGWLLGSLWPGLEVRALFGFGYLLPTMIALRVLRAGDDPFRPIVPAVVTSLAGFFTGSAVGYALAVLLPAPAEEREPLPSPGDADLALATLAWGNAGPAPDAADLLAAPGPEGVVGGGDGFGALWIRPEGRPIAVTARVGSPGMAAALAAVALATDARAVLLCGPHGPACDAARSELARRLPLVRLEDGNRTVLQVAGRIPAVLRTADLSSALGPVAIEPGTGDAVLLLAPDARMRAAARDHIDPAPLDADRLGRPLDPASGSDPVALRVMDEEVVGTWLSWWRRDPWGDDALRAATAMGAELGLELTASGDRSALEGPGFRVILDRDGTPDMVEVQEAAPGHRTVGVARALAVALGSSAVVEGALPGLARLGASDAEAPVQAALVALFEGGLGPELTTVRTSRDGRDPGSDLVFSLGRPAFDPAAVGAVLPALADTLAFSWSPFDGAFPRAWFQDPGNVGRAVAHAVAGGEAAITVYAGPDVRSRLGGDPEDVPLAFAIRTGLLPVETADLWSGRGSAPGGEWDAARALAHRAVASGALADLKALRREGDVRAVRDPVLGTRWLGVRKCASDVGCEWLLVPLTGPCDDCAAGSTARAALALGTADLAFR